MAPWPEQGSEPKAPDKDNKCELVEGVAKLDLEDRPEGVPASRTDQPSKQPEEKEVLTLDEGQLKALLDEAITYKNPKDREGKSELFKELLLEVEADESDSKGLANSLTGKLPRGLYNLPVRRRHTRHQGKECGVGVSTTRGGSLQNLNALGMEGSRVGRSRRSGRSGETLVSARQREGGSLPTNVNVDNDPDLDAMIYPNYTSRATLEVSGLSRDDGIDDGVRYHPSSVLQGSYITNGNEILSPHMTTQNPNRSLLGLSLAKDDNSDHSFASSICVGPVESGAMLYPPSPMQHVSVLSIPPPQIHVGSDEHRNLDNSEHKKVNNPRKGHKKGLMPARSDSVPAPVIIHQPDQEVELASDGLLGLPLTAHWNRFSSFTLLDFRDPSSRMATFGKDSSDSKTKSLDENGNALSCLRMDSNCLDRKKRRVKTKNDKNIRDFMSNDVEGFRGGADIETLMEYIESPSNILDGTKANKTRSNQTNGSRNHVKVRAREEDSRSIKRRTKEKFQRCNSLEEISKTKLEDLTEESSSERVNGSGFNIKKVQVTLDDAQLELKSSWDDDTILGNSDNIKKNKETKLDKTSQDGLQESEFHVVTKKQRKRKRRTGCSGRVGSKPVFYGARGFPAHDRTLERDGSSGLLYQYGHGRSSQSGSQPRRKSASSVPPSDKSDSSDLDSVHSLPVSSTTARTKLGKNSVSGGSTPQASYADIAKTMASPPDTGSQGNICKQGKCSPYLSSAGPDFDMSSSSSDPIPSVMLPTTFASPFKKDAMTDTNCDTIKSSLPNEEYPPLEIKCADLFIDATVKHSRCGPRDNNIPDEKMNVKTVPINIVIPVSSESGDVPQSLPVDVPSSVKSPLVNSNCKRPPVILMDEPMVNSQLPTELTFGFEVNQQLLQSDYSMCNLNNVVTSSCVGPAAVVPSPPPQHTSTDNSLKRLVQFLSSGWDDTMKDLRLGRAIYYNGQ